jgi:hypothetical protein
MSQEALSLQDTIRIPVDPEPTSLRIALVGIFIAGVVVGYVTTVFAFPQGTCSPLAFIVGLVVGAGLMQISEIYLKPRWQSNKFVECSTAQLHVLEKNQPTQIIKPEGTVTLDMWYFVIPRATRVPKGWYMVALSAEVKDIFLPVYALVSPEQFETLPYSDHFKMLTSKEELKGGDLSRLSKQQRRLLKAEAARDIHGAEMTYENLVTYINWLEVHFPEWFPTH